MTKIETHLVCASIKSPQRIRDGRKQLVIAAVEVFLCKSFHETTVRDIGAAAKLTHVTIYNYIQSNDDILFLVCEEVVGAYQRVVQRFKTFRDLINSRLRSGIPLSRCMSSRSTSCS